MGHESLIAEKGASVDGCRWVGWQASEVEKEEGGGKIISEVTGWRTDKQTDTARARSYGLQFCAAKIDHMVRPLGVLTI